ncbi:putative MATE family efflux protein [Microcella putealis]|uniref:Putative MATE family efflux protein n=1 Tax=Microcella putealis TaxID=337005 RepID=A0A4Q7LQX8_9MICO|nr:MATE family efflux transporter [Microcella putealis]RZS56278.1 putative MATE family efflux protein [Microcella putealis]TQM27236.1 putative MATE family efflux protein [Microcella putealis]
MLRCRVTSLDRDILRLAVPSLGALVAEPVFVLTDTAMVGHLGAPALAGLGIASTVLQTAVGLLIFLAYATTPIVARRLGAGDRPGALSAGVDGLWLALGLGVVLLATLLPLSPVIVGAFGVEAAVATAALDYLTIAWWGIPGMLLVLAATGVLRGLQDARTPLIVAAAGFTANIALNAALIYGLGLGVAGSALGTVIAQWGMAAVLVALVVRAARREHAALRPSALGIRAAGQAGSWLLVRTLSLRIALVVTVVVAAELGTDELAATQIWFALYSLLALALDALAIAGQALIGHDLGAGNVPRVHAITRRLVGWGVGVGVALMVPLLAATPLLTIAMTSDDGVRALIPLAVVTLAVGLPLAGLVFVLDGVLIGAGDGRYLAVTGILNLIAYLAVLAIAIGMLSTGLAGLFLSFMIGYLAARAATLGWRARGTRWIVTGASHKTGGE